MNIDIEKLIKETLQSETFAYALAERIASEYKQHLFDEFGDKIAKEMDKRVKEISKQFVEDFEVDSDIRYLVEKTFSLVSKEELLKILLKDNQDEQE